MDTEHAEILALQGLGWLATDEAGMQRFLHLSGLDAQSLRANTGTLEMNVAILDFLLGHEDLLLDFCKSLAASPKDLHMARFRLGGES